MTTQLTSDDRELLDRPLHGFLTVATPGRTRPRPRPVWFEVTGDGHVQLFSETGSAKVRRLAADPWASLVVARPTGETEYWVEIAGQASVHPDGAADLSTRLAARYWDLDDPARAAELESLQDLDTVRIVIRPDSVRRFAG